MINTKGMSGRSLLTINDLSDGELFSLIKLAAELKTHRKAGKSEQRLAGRTVALIFEKLSTRTRCAFAVAAAEEGANTEYLRGGEIHLGKKESVKDTARVLGRMFDAIAFRGYEHSRAADFKRFSGVPVWNALTDDHHPTQALADLMTIRENFGQLRGINVTYVGDGRNNVANSLMAACAKTGINFVNCTPEELLPDEELLKNAKRAAERNGGSIRVTSSVADGVRGTNVIYTDVWASMGEESVMEQRIEMLRPYCVNEDMIEQAGTMKSNELIFLHCLPAFHDNNTEATAQTGALEVTDEVFEASYSKVFDQAENRVHSIKALMVATLGS